jgi:hypothetical protein
MSVVEFTPRAVQDVLDILGQSNRCSEDTFLLVEVQEEAAEISFRQADEVVEMQRDLDVMGPFLVPVGEVEMSLFVRDSDPDRGGRIELDSLAVGGQCNFQIRGIAD